MYLSSSLRFSISLIILTLTVLLFADSQVWASGHTYGNAKLSEQLITHFTNSAREQNGVSTVSTSPNMAAAAQAKADRMSEMSEFQHTLSDGTTSWEILREHNYCYKYAGENLAVHFTSAENTVEAWMNSPSHRQNLLSANYKDIGIGIAPIMWNGHEGLVIVQLFGIEYTPADVDYSSFCLGR